MKLKAGVIKRIHVNQHHHRANRKDGGSRPVFTVKTTNGNYYGQSVKISGPCEFVNSVKPLSCGAHIWCSTTSEVEVIK